MTPARLKAWYGVHKWSSLVSTAFFLLLCLTGLPLIFAHEIDHWLSDAPEPAPMPADTPRASLDAIVADASARRPNEALQFVWTEEDEPSLWFVALGETADADESSSVFAYDARTAEMLHEVPLRQGIVYVLWKLHVDLFAGLPGTLFVGFVGLLVVASLVSGAVVYGPFMRRLPFGAVRAAGSRRTLWLDVHDLVGITTLAWVLVVTLTGVVNTLAIPILGLWKATELAEMTAPYRGRPPLEDRGSVEAAMRAALAGADGYEIDFIAFPGNDFAGPHHYAAFLRGSTPLTARLLEPVLVDAASGEVTERRALPWYATTLLVSQPLHFGDYGGMPLKILWAVLDVLVIVVVASGLYLWLARGRKRVEQRIEEIVGAEVDAPTPRQAVR